MKKMLTENDYHHGDYSVFDIILINTHKFTFAAFFLMKKMFIEKIVCGFYFNKQ